jgi:hypothetical protein
VIQQCQVVSKDRAIYSRQFAKVHLGIQERQIISKALAIQDCQIASNDLAIRESQIASNQDDACPHHLAMLVTSCSCHQARGKGIHVKCSTLPTVNLLKTNTR